MCAPARPETRAAGCCGRPEDKWRKRAGGDHEKGSDPVWVAESKAAKELSMVEKPPWRLWSVGDGVKPGHAGEQ